MAANYLIIISFSVTSRCTKRRAQWSSFLSQTTDFIQYFLSPFFTRSTCELKVGAYVADLLMWIK